MAFQKNDREATITLRTSNDAETTSADEAPELPGDGAGATSPVPVGIAGASEMELGGIAIGERAATSEEILNYN